MGFMKQRVVVPIDFSEEAFSALDTALEIVEDPKYITIVHVLQDLHPAEFGEVYNTVTPESREHHIRAALKERLADAKYRDIGVQVRFDEPAPGIAEFAQEHNADLIVLPCHGRTGFKRLLIGSVAERVVRLAHCPVLVLRG